MNTTKLIEKKNAAKNWLRRNAVFVVPVTALGGLIGYGIYRGSKLPPIEVFSAVMSPEQAQEFAPKFFDLVSEVGVECVEHLS